MTDQPCCSGFDRGHMAPAGNHRKDQTMCDQTFLLSNMAPQVITMAIKVTKVSARWGRGSTGTNGNTWSAMQGNSPNSTGRSASVSYVHSIKLVKLFRNVYVCTGPLYLPHMEGDGKMYVKYQVSQTLILLS